VKEHRGHLVPGSMDHLDLLCSIIDCTFNSGFESEAPDSSRSEAPMQCPRSNQMTVAP
jgi:hypothetical protein